MSAALVAFNPQFLFISGVANNDNLLNLATTGGLWQLLRAMKAPEQTRQWIYVGIWVAVGILAKLSAFVIAGLAGLVLVGCAFERRSPNLFLRGALAMLIVVGLITGWWFMRNQILYGDPLGWSMYKEVFAVNIRDTPLQVQDYRDFFSTQFRSFWGVFGWMNISAPTWYVSITRMFSFLGLIGLVVFIFRARKCSLSGIQVAQLITIFTICVLQEIFLLYLIQNCNSSCYQGRYLFPTIGPLMILFTVGLGSLLAKSLRTTAISILTLFMFFSALFILFRVIQPAYEITALPKSTLRSIPNKTEYNFGSIFALQGYDLLTPLEERAITLTFYW